MKKNEFEALKKRVVTLISNSIQQDQDMTQSFNTSMAKSLFINLPKHKEVIKTCHGIIGFYEFCKEKNMMYNFATNALHDIRECAYNYQQPWFCPRTSRYAKQS